MDDGNYLRYISFTNTGNWILVDLILDLASQKFIRMEKTYEKPFYYEI